MGQTAELLCGALVRVPSWCVDTRALSRFVVENLAVASAAGLGYRVQKSRYEPLYAFDEERQYYHFPRGIDPDEYVRVGFEWKVVQQFDRSLNTSEMPTRIPPVRSLWPAQEAPMQALRKQDGDKLLCLGCGRGKTTLALMDAMERGQRTLIVVDRDFQIEQWIRDIRDTFGDYVADSVGVIQGAGKREIGQWFTLAMLQTLARFTDEEFAEIDPHFGFVIVDEAHVAGAPLARRIFAGLSGTRLGLSATPERRDGLMPFFAAHMGNTPIYTDTTPREPATWVFRDVDLSHIDNSDMWRRLPGRERNGEPVLALQRAVFDTLATEDLAWRAERVREITKAANSGRNVLVLGTRTEDLTATALDLQALGIDASFVNAGVKNKKKNRAREDAFERQVILATGALASKALDIPRLDMLVLVFPSDDENFLRQAKGRIDRLYEGRKPPLVLTYVPTGFRNFAKLKERMIGLIKDFDRGRIVHIKAGR